MVQLASLSHVLWSRITRSTRWFDEGTRCTQTARCTHDQTHDQTVQSADMILLCSARPSSTSCSSGPFGYFNAEKRRPFWNSAAWGHGGDAAVRGRHPCCSFSGCVHESLVMSASASAMVNSTEQLEVWWAERTVRCHGCSHGADNLCRTDVEFPSPTKIRRAQRTYS